MAIFDIENPLAPVLIQDITMVLAGTNPPLHGRVPSRFPSAAFQLALDPTYRWLYVVNHATSVTSYPEGNNIHILGIHPDGTVAELKFSPVLLPVPANVNPTGIAIR